MSTKTLLTWPLAVLLAACATSGLDSLVLDGHELHSSLVLQSIDGATGHSWPPEVRDNPQLSTDAEFVATIARSSGQGRLGSEGVRAALYARYRGESEIGLYGLEAASTTDADRIEDFLRETWAYTENLGFARVHRGGDVLVVMWCRRVAPACWEAVNAAIAERLVAAAGS